MYTHTYSQTYTYTLFHTNTQTSITYRSNPVVLLAIAKPVGCAWLSGTCQGLAHTYTHLHIHRVLCMYASMIVCMCPLCQHVKHTGTCTQDMYICMYIRTYIRLHTFTHINRHTHSLIHNTQRCVINTELMGAQH